MDNIKVIGICVFLLIGVIFDFCYKKIPRWYAYLFVIVGILSVIFFKNNDWYLYFLGGAFGGLFFILAKISDESVGYGDAYVVTGLGLVLGIKNIFLGIFFALCMMFPVSVVLLCIKKITKKTNLPFIPFVFCGILLQLLIGENL